MAITVQIKLNDKLYLRDPQETKLGCRIIQHSILLIDEIGFESFTFKKLAERIGSTEASVYRYFENKHVLLVYLVCWYWEWVRFQIELRTKNLTDAREKLNIIIDIIVESSQENQMIPFVNENALNRIIVEESSKAYHTKRVDSENKEGFFTNYKELCAHISNVFLEINPEYPYSRALASTLLETANNQLFFARHLPSLTNVNQGKTQLEQTKELLRHFSFGLLCSKNPSGN